MQTGGRLFRVDLSRMALFSPNVGEDRHGPTKVMSSDAGEGQPPVSVVVVVKRQADLSHVTTDKNFEPWTDKN